MRNGRIIALVAAALLTGVPPRLVAQSASGDAQWETLARAPLPAGIEPILNINALRLPPEPTPRVTQPHTHSGPVVGYIVDGQIENQIEPEAPVIHKPGGFFLEPPMHVHTVLRNLSTTDSATLIICQVGRTRVPESLLKPLTEEAIRLVESDQPWQTTFRSAANQELRVYRLTLPAGASVDSRPHTGPGFVYVLRGRVRTSAASVPVRTHRAGDLFLDPAYRAGLAFTNTSQREPATLLLYQVGEPSSP
jgi:hypothetical protein